jgi:hypothetical protein
MKWHSTYEDPIRICGLPWAYDNAPDMWRLPRTEIDRMPWKVRELARYATGATIRLATDSTALSIRAAAVSDPTGAGIDVYVDGTFWRAVDVSDPSETEICCFDDRESRRREITLYLPSRQEVRIAAVGVDRDADLFAPKDYSQAAPVVLYGSSIAQGAHAARSGMGYGAHLGRSMNLDVVNLGFGGAGKAEQEVGELVSRIDACCFILDVGKSYGMQSPDAFARLLEQLRAAQGSVPIVCITPIYATRELYETDYVALSMHTREAVRRGAIGRYNDGDTSVLLVEGPMLLGKCDSDGFCGDGLHPNDIGHARIARRLRGIIADVLG